MVAFNKVHQYTVKRDGTPQMVRENHYVMLSKEGMGRIFLQDGACVYEDGLPLTPTEQEAWADVIEKVSMPAKTAVGFGPPSTGPAQPPRELTRTQWIYGDNEGEELCIGNGEFWGPDGMPVDADMLPVWAHHALALMSNVERKRAGLLPIAVTEFSEDEDQDAEEASWQAEETYLEAQKSGRTKKG